MLANTVDLTYLSHLSNSNQLYEAFQVYIAAIANVVKVSKASALTNRPPFSYSYIISFENVLKESNQSIYLHCIG